MGWLARPVHQTYHQIERWARSPSCFKRQVATRGAALAVIPLELLLLIGRLIRLPFILLVEMPLKLSVCLVRLGKRSRCLKNLDHQLGGLKQVKRTSERIMVYILALFSTLLLGCLFSPKMNVKSHDGLGVWLRTRKQLPAPLFDEREDIELHLFEGNSNNFSEYPTDLE